MSLITSLPYRIKTSRFESGIGHASLVDEDELPEPYSTLYVTIKVRNSGQWQANDVSLRVQKDSSQGIKNAAPGTTMRSRGK